MSIDTIGNFLTIIRNGVLASKAAVKAPYSVMKYQVAQILKDEGFIRDVVVEENDGKKNIKISLKYVQGESVIHDITRVSKPSRRAYKGFASIDPVIGGLGISILSTNKGIMTDKKAKQLSVGGEVVCTVW